MSSRFAPVPLAGTGPDIVDDIVSWITSAPLSALITEFGGDPSLVSATRADLAEKLARLDEFTDRWDTRNGRERNLADELPLAGAQDALVLEAADALGFCGVRRPLHASYDYVLMLGGLVRACFARPAYAAHLVGSRQIAADTVVALCGHRPFAGDELGYAAELGIPDIAEEYDAMDAGTRRAFGVSEPESVEGETSDLVGGTWGVRRYRAGGGMPVLVAAAPSTDPRNRRANTPDSYAWFAEYLANLKPGQRLLMVTTPIYVPPQHAAAVRMLRLPYGVEVDTVGNDPAVTATVVQRFTPTKYLLEVRSAIRALRQLHAAAVEG